MKYLITLLTLFIFSTLSAQDYKEFSYANRTDVRAFIAKMVDEHNFSKQLLINWFSEVQYKQSIINAITRPAEQKFSWGRYRKIFMTEKRIDQGVNFWHKNQKVLNQMELEFGIPAEIIVAVIGVETFYGSNKGTYRVIDALCTLGFDYPKRAKFFSKELEEFLLLAREQNQSPLELTGSYAGAMGYGQFIPSSYRAYAKDYDGDNFADIWNNENDAIWSVANYLQQHGWQTGAAISVKIDAEGIKPEWADNKLKPRRTIGDIQQAVGQLAIENELIKPTDKAILMLMDADSSDEYWLGLHNFYVITRYNHSKLYAMAVYQLSQAIKAKK